MTPEDFYTALLQAVDTGQVVARLDGVTLSPAEHTAWITAGPGSSRERIVYSVPS